MHIVVAAVEVATKAGARDTCDDDNNHNPESEDTVLAVNAGNAGDDAISPDMNLVISDMLNKPMENNESDMLGF